jgi:methylphosphotriester-DNA--protein-cysteine methyltransferase
MKIEKETLQRYRSLLKPDNERMVPMNLERNQQRQVVEFALELIDAADGGPDIQKLRQELGEKENQLKAILVDIDNALLPQYATTDQISHARYIIVTALKYLYGKKTKEFQSWKDYRVMVDEEFSS